MDKKPSLLLVDDNPANLSVLVGNLRGENYELLTATTGERALGIAQKAVPNLILLDIMMPGINGFEMCRRLKEIEVTKDIPVIFLSALGEVADKLKGFEVGGVDYITKPFQKAEVLMRIETHLKINRLVRQLAQSLAKEKELSAHLLELSTKDPLTNLYNRRYFFDRIEEEIQRAIRKKELMVIAIFDIDFFKCVNDTYGHLCGDFILKELSAMIRKNVRETDLLARFGGEEFVAAFFDVELNGIYKRLADIREGIASHLFVFEGNSIRRTLSIGFTVFQPDLNGNVKVQHLVSEADRALYHAKETGRNKIVPFSTELQARRFPARHVPARGGP